MKCSSFSFLSVAVLMLALAPPVFAQSAGQGDGPPRPFGDLENEAIHHVLAIGESLAGDSTEGVRREAADLLALKDDVKTLLAAPARERGTMPRSFEPAMGNLFRAAEFLAKPAYACPEHPRTPSPKPGACTVCEMDLQEVDPEIKSARSAYVGLSQASLAFLRDEQLKAALQPVPDVFYCPMVKLPWLQTGEALANPGGHGGHR